MRVASRIGAPHVLDVERFAADEMDQNGTATTPHVLERTADRRRAKAELD